MRLTLAFGLLGLAVATLAVQGIGETTGPGWVLVAVQAEVAVCLLALATLYGLQAVGVDVEPGLSWPRRLPITRVVVLPYLVLGAITLALARRFDRPGMLLNPLTPGLFVGRLPFPGERAEVRAAGVVAVLNLCWEFPRLSRLDRDPTIETVRVPILDGAAPSARQFVEAVDQVERWILDGKIVLIHCAQGHGRTSTIAAAVLIRLGLATDVDQALAMVRAARPRARPSKEQRAALERFARGHFKT